MLSTVAIIPCFNHAATVGEMARAVMAHGLDVLLVDDGSSLTCAAVLDALTATNGRTLTVLRLAFNGGKGAAVVAGIRAALAGGYTHALQIDADGQHDSGDIPAFLALSSACPESVICGTPVYDDSVPKSRFYGRYATHVWVWINTLSLDIRDSMCGFRVYPLESVVSIIEGCSPGRRMDFDTEILVRLHWRGIHIVNLPTRVRYPAGGVSHFRQIRDNILISLMHARLLAGMLIRLPVLLSRKAARR